MSFKWNEKFSVGIKSIDNQHKKIINYINKLSALKKKKYHEESVLEILTELRKYIKSHFAHEEKLFHVNGYPETFEHSNAHKKFSEYINNFYEEVISKKAVDIEKMESYLVSWFMEHILVEDKKYEEFFKEHNVI
ncbi:MAG: hemerythrin family protein [Halobacteriovoraceae bacterium]|nr:hemerythrin family protein [Halobacteriovoraceae bacterium]